MISPQNHEFSIAEILSGSVSKWYADVDNCLAMSEVIPGQYEYTTATSYGNSGGINENASTFLDIQADRFKLVSIDNSFASFEHTYIIEVPKQDDMYASVPNAGIYYIGQLYGPAAIGAYRIRSNTDEIQTVNHANYEWFLQYQSTPDEVKENNENYATIKKIREMNPMVPGAYVDLSQITAGTKVEVPVKIKVPLNSFLLLKNLKWLPSWMGKLTIEYDKANESHTHSMKDITDYKPPTPYDDTEIRGLINGKANESHTHNEFNNNVTFNNKLILKPVDNGNLPFSYSYAFIENTYGQISTPNGDYWDYIVNFTDDSSKPIYIKAANLKVDNEERLIKVERGKADKNMTMSQLRGLETFKADKDHKHEVSDINGLKDAMLDIFYPIGSIYTSMNNTNPSNLFGGTWTQIKDRFMYCTTNSKQTGGGGGITMNNIQKKHYEGTASYGDNHGIIGKYSGSRSGIFQFGTEKSERIAVERGTGNHGYDIKAAFDVGVDNPSTYYPPYITVFAWYRTA